MPESQSAAVPEVSRRGFIGAAAVIGGAAVAGVAVPETAQAATGVQAARGARHGDIRDIKRVMIIMQENRSFDHYFGALKGVRGFADRSTIQLPGGLPVFRQPTTAPGAATATTQYPWHLSDAPASAYPSGHQPPSSEVGAQGYGGTSHSWDDQHLAWNGGLMNGWVSAKGGLTTLGYLNRSDIPFHYALADAYTVGDAYHCSVLSATGPNRTYLWSGTIDAQRKYSEFVAFNGGDEVGKNLLWETYAETLQKAGVSWKIYQGSDNFGDNGLQYFDNFAKLDPTQGGTAAPGNPLYDKGLAVVAEPSTADDANGDNLINAIKADVKAGTLAEVTWVVSNQTFSEHPDGAPDDGANLVSGILKALNSDPDVFNSTLVIINYDENDGQFDHVPPPVPDQGATDEFYQEASGTLTSQGVNRALPVGLGFRVPLILVSPWTRGGWVTSEVSDHTSVIQFLEKWTRALGKPALCPNISTWRRQVCSDLTGAFDFTAPVFGLPKLPKPTAVLGDPAGGAYAPPVTTNAMPAQESGAKPARSLPYQPNANLDGFVSGSGGSVQAKLLFSNGGPNVRKASHLSVYNNAAPAATLAGDQTLLPQQYTLAPSRSSTPSSVAGKIEIGAGHGDGKYDLTVVGPNRFLRHFSGDVDGSGRSAEVRLDYDQGGSHPKLRLRLVNDGSAPVTFTVTPNHYSTDRVRTFRVPKRGQVQQVFEPFENGHGWYDFSVTLAADASWSRRYVGHLENGRSSITG